MSPLTWQNVWRGNNSGDLTHILCVDFSGSNNKLSQLFLNKQIQNQQVAQVKVLHFLNKHIHTWNQFIWSENLSNNEMEDTNLCCSFSCRISKHWLCGGPTTKTQPVKLWKVCLCCLPAAWIGNPHRGVALLFPLTFCTCERKDSHMVDTFPLVSSLTGYREENNGKEKAAVSLIYLSEALRLG